MSTTKSPSPSPSAPPVGPYIPSHRFEALCKIYQRSLSATLKANSYPNFASCFPTPATYCPKALEGVWNQLNTRLEEQCLKDFDKLCEERGLQQALGEWEQVLDDARIRKVRALDGGDAQNGHSHLEQLTPMHMLTGEQLRNAHVAPVLVKVEKELQKKLSTVQGENEELISKIELQRAEMQRLVEQLERVVEDIEGAAVAVEQDQLRGDLRKGVMPLDLEKDIVMNG